MLAMTPVSNISELNLIVQLVDSHVTSTSKSKNTCRKRQVKKRALGDAIAVDYVTLASAFNIQCMCGATNLNSRFRGVSISRDNRLFVNQVGPASPPWCTAGRERKRGERQRGERQRVGRHLAEQQRVKSSQELLPGIHETFFWNPPQGEAKRDDNPRLRAVCCAWSGSCFRD